MARPPDQMIKLRKRIAAQYGFNSRYFRSGGIDFNWFMSLDELARKVIANDIRSVKVSYPEFFSEEFVNKAESATEHIPNYHPDVSGVNSMGDDDIKVVYEIYSKKVLGTAWKVGNEWYATMGYCWVGKYEKWDDALINIIVAYYG